MKSVVVAFALVTAATAAIAQSSQHQNAQTTGQQGQEGAAKADQKGERLICRRVGAAATGSQLGHRQCLTAAQWRALNQRR